MKNLILILATFCFVFANNRVASQNEIPYTASEIMEKCIQFHDPEGKWENYSGALHLKHVRENGASAGFEIIEIDVKDDFYKLIFNYNNGTEVIKGTKNGEYFYSINGNSNPTQDDIAKYGLTNQQIDLWKTWHYFHFGKMMHMKRCGMVLQEKVTENAFDYEIVFLGEKNKVTNPSWEGEYKLKVNKESFALVGMVFSFDNRLFNIEYIGFFNNNGIQINKTAIGAEAGKNDVSIDLFSKFDGTNFPKRNEKADKEKEAILKVMKQETDVFAKHDMETLTTLHVQSEMDTRLAGAKIYKGWDEVEALLKSYIERNKKDTTSKNIRNEKENIRLKVTGNTAWVICDNIWKWEESGETKDLQNIQISFLEKIDGKWKFSFNAFVAVPDTN